MNLFDNEKQKNWQKPNSDNTTINSKKLMQAQKLIDQLSSELLKLKSTERVCVSESGTVKSKSEAARRASKNDNRIVRDNEFNQQLSRENDNLRNRNGLMLREQQEKLERENADFQDQNSKLCKLVDLSCVEAVNKAQKEKEDALRLAAEERKKTKNEIAKMKRRAEKVISETKRKLSFWRMVAVGMLLLGVLIGYTQLWM